MLGGMSHAQASSPSLGMRPPDLWIEPNVCPSNFAQIMPGPVTNFGRGKITLLHHVVCNWVFYVVVCAWVF